ncbi:hypothetical protein AGR6A_Cc150008 [Agrobacterium sp. NCPPB 925]|nr:hypothetical protein AGR6A_Cc150008 [Agrobacterium sp. NCPPB 925]
MWDSYPQASRFKTYYAGVYRMPVNPRENNATSLADVSVATKGGAASKARNDRTRPHHWPNMPYDANLLPFSCLGGYATKENKRYDD